ncbi:MAG: right-handed parallel beta-helix repeat-containing protein [Verrucomicrobiales bacterium]|nr:right-handed parallel beta-helix repeat-containing protein [Verrucomicrobiales bacterium]
MHAAVGQEEIFLSASGSGTQDGLSFANSGSARDGGLQRAWDSIPPGGTVWLAVGEYQGLELTCRSSSETDKGVRTLCGQVVGDKRPVIIGAFDPDRPESSARTAITIAEGTSRVAVRDFSFRRFGTALHARGGNEDITIQGVRVAEARECIRIEGRGKAARGTQRVTVERCRFELFTKKGVRLCPGNMDVKIRQCLANAGGREWMKEKFHMGFFVDDDCDNITFSDCEAKRSHDEAGQGYWNADGYCVERAGHVRWERCRAFDCTDGGWDSKAAHNELIDCVAARNKRNYRFWGEAFLTNCLSVFPTYPGGSGGALALWSRGAVRASHCTFVGDQLFETDEGGIIQVEQSLLVRTSKSDDQPDQSGVSKRSCSEQRMDVRGLADLFEKPERATEDGSGFKPHNTQFGFLPP